jgi:hypothetical protein
MKEKIFNVKNDEDSHLGEYKIPRRSSNMGHDVFKPYLRISKNLKLSREACRKFIFNEKECGRVSITTRLLSAQSTS